MLTRFALALGTALTPVALAAQELPTGGTVAHGSATIATPAPNAMTINQSSDRAIVNWNGFSIGQGNRVDINQPSASSAILNRVTGDTTSQIHGQLNANGRVFVVNPNGVFIGQTGSVNTGSFVASTLNIRNDDFVTGNLVFEGDGSSSVVENAGNVQVVTGGYAALIGGKVKNSGTIQAPLGFVGLGSGERITLDLAGDGFLQVAIPTDADDDGLDALIENSGTIQANGGTVQISAATARNAARHAINMSGVVEARTVSGRNGRVTLGGGGGGKVSVSGKIRTKTRTRPAIQVTQSARPALRPERGGEITITGREISLAGADIDASGLNGGGNIRIGGELQGGDGLPTADFLTVDTSTHIAADALLNGDGGRVILWSDLRTDFNGNISVRGGDQGGDGGFAEVSGFVDLRYNGFTDALAPNGAPGDLLLDPADIEIVAGAVAFNQILDTDLEAQLAGANVLIGTSPPNLPNPADYPSSGLGFGEQPGDLGTITVTTLADVTWNSGTTLTFDADQDIILNGDITPNNGGLSLNAGGRVVFNGAVITDGGTLNVDAGDDFTIAGSGNVSAANTTITAFATDIEVDGTFSATSGTTTLESSNTLVIETPNVFDATGSDTTLESGDVTIDRPITVTGGILDVQAGNSINVTTAGAINGAGAFTRLNAAGPITLNGPIITPTGDTRVNASNDTATPGPGGEVETGQFVLGNTTTWNQSAMGGSIADFEAGNFVIELGGSFLRAIDGDGTIATPFEIADVYGLQGIGTRFSGTGNYELADNIDAGFTSDWFSLDAPVNGTVDQGFVPYPLNGVLNGNRFTISDLFIRRHGETGGGGTAGLFSTIGSTGSVFQLNLANANVGGTTVGILAAGNDGTVLGVSATGNVTVFNENSSSTFGGGIAGINAGGIGGSFTNVTITDADDPSATFPGPSESHFAGGIAGSNLGNILATRSSGNISYDNAQVGYVGGIAGSNSDDVEDSYSDATVSANTLNGTSAHVGSITGRNLGVIARTIANGPVSIVGGNLTGGVGATTGTDDASDVSVISSFFSVAGTGQTVSGTNSEDTGTGPGLGTYFEGSVPDAEINPGDAFVVLTDVEPFVFLASVGGSWDFDNIWAFPQDGIDQARLYTVDPVISAIDFSTPEPSIEYAGPTLSFNGVAPTYGGGPTNYFFGPLGDTGDLTVLADGVTLASTDAGMTSYTFPTSFTSDLGQVFDVRSLDYPITITPAPLTVTVADVDKPFGTELTFDQVSFNAETFFGADGITSATVDSTGADANAPVSDIPVPLSLSGFTGPGITNYSITVIPGNLRVIGTTLLITVDSFDKVYGETLIFDGTEFTVEGLPPGVSVTSLVISSAGAEATATVADGPYSVEGTNPVGTGIDDFTFTIVPGTLTVTPAPLTLTIDDQTKVYGTEQVFAGTEFTATGLVNTDTVDTLSIASAGAAPTAVIADGPFDITGTDPVGTGLENYDIAITSGTMTVTPAPLLVTADDQNKPAGTEFVFTGTEFTVAGLVNGDTLTSATLSSEAAVATAGLTGEAGVAILITDPVGTGLENYEITLVGGIMIIAPGNLVITAVDQTKTYGETFTFDGTEFTVVGLAEGDSVDSVTLVSAGAVGTAQVGGSPFSIQASNAVGTGLEKYTLVFADGTLTVVPAPLTVTATDQFKQEGQLLTFAGTEFDVAGLVNGDTVTSAILSSDGAAEAASADDSPFAIVVGDLTGTGLDNYTIATVDGALTVGNIITTPEINPTPSITPRIENGRDSISIAVPSGDSGVAGIQNEGGGSGGPQQSLGDAQATFDVVDTISTELELAVQSCGNAEQDFSNYMTCLSESLDTYSNALDQISNDLPAGLETVSATIRTAADEVRAAAARAQARLATATSDTQRRAIQREAIAEARGAIDTAKEEIRKAISLIRADDPEVQAVQQQTGARIVAAFDTVDSALARATDL